MDHSVTAHLPRPISPASLLSRLEEWLGRKEAEMAEPISPHSLRHSFITAALDAGVPLRDVQEAASHADPRTTMRYDRARRSLDRHASYVVSTFIDGATLPHEQGARAARAPVPSGTADSRARIGTFLPVITSGVPRR
jgi:integrase